MSKMKKICLFLLGIYLITGNETSVLTAIFFLLFGGLIYAGLGGSWNDSDSDDDGDNNDDSDSGGDSGGE